MQSSKMLDDHATSLDHQATGGSESRTAPGTAAVPAPAHAREPTLQFDPREIGLRAAGLFDRLETETSPWQEQKEQKDGHDSAMEVLAAWRKAFAANDEAALTRRLAWDGLDPETARARLATTPGLPAGATDWTRGLPVFLAAAERCYRVLGEDEDDDEDEEGRLPHLTRLALSPEPPFVEIWVPLLDAARAALTRDKTALQCLLAPEALAAFEAQLLREIASAGELAVLETFRSFIAAEPPRRADYPAFVRQVLGGELASLFSAYPVLARQLARLVSTWVASMNELIQRLEEDHEAIGACFGGGDPGRVVAARTGLSDRHHGGRRVCVLTFGSGLRLVYKPREVGLEHAFNAFLAWARRAGLDSAPRSLRILERDGYGWVEFVQQEPCADRAAARESFRRAGSLLLMAYALRGRDLHNENVIATRNGPVLVDTEALLQPVEVTEDEERPSCLATGFVTLQHVDSRGAAYDVGGLRPSVPRSASVGRRVFRSLHSLDLSYTTEKRMQPEVANGVLLGGELQAPETYAREIADGFAKAYRFLVAHGQEALGPDGPLAAFEGCRTRVLFRPSDQYGTVLFLLGAPRYQRCGWTRGVALETLNRIFAREPRIPHLWPLVADERAALEGLDIPRFTLPTSETCLRSGRGELVEGHFALSGLAAVRRRVEGMCEEDLGRQLDLIASALPASASAEPAPVATQARAEGGAGQQDRTGPALWKMAAESIGLRLLQEARRDGREGLKWAAAGRRQDLYGGQAGIVLFFAALGRVTQESRWVEAAVAAAASLRRAVRGESRPRAVGVCTGSGSLIYSLTWIGRWLAGSGSTELAVELARELTSARIENATGFDVEAGLAGALLALLVLKSATGEAWLLERARLCGRRLLAEQVEQTSGGAAWPGRDGRAPAGFAHGAAGIAYALTRLYRLTGQAELLAAVRRAHAYERGLFVPAEANWPALREGTGSIIMTAWCHGAPGIALTRALGMHPGGSGGDTTALNEDEDDDDDEVRGEIGTAIKTTLRAPPARYDHLCCGNLGRSDVLLTVGNRLADPALVEAAKDLATRVAERVSVQGAAGARAAGFENGTASPGFFQGLAGIGYQLLRTAEPTRLPTVLGFETEV